MPNEHIKSVVTVKQFSGDLARYEPLIAKLLPRHFPAERLVNLAVTAFMRSEDLRKCSMISIVNSICIAAQLGLEPNTSLGHGWLIPYAGICQFQPGYRGLIHLALQSPRVTNVQAHVVRGSDQFSLSYGTRGELLHIPDIKGGDDRQDEWDGAYCLVQYKEGPPSYLFLTSAEIKKIKSSSKTSGKGPWVDWPEEMWRKSAAKRHLKYEQLSPLISRAVGYDEQHESGKMQDVIVEGVDYSVVDETMNPEAQVDPNVKEARERAANPPLKDRVTGKGKQPDSRPPDGRVDIGARTVPEFTGEWPDSFDGPECIWNGKHLKFNEESGNYKEVVP